MRDIIRMAGWGFTVFFLYQAGLNLTEFFMPRSVMPCVTRILDDYVLFFIFPMSFIMGAIVISDVRGLRRSMFSGAQRAFHMARVISGSAATIAAFCAAAVILAR